MQNFGRGMWRRVGDYQRIQSPQIVRDNQIQQLQQYLAIAEQQKYYTYKQQSTQINNTNNITPKTELKNLETLKKGDYSVLEKIVEEPVVNEALEELAVNEALEEPVINKTLEEPVINKALEEPVINKALEEPVINKASEEPPKVVEPKKTKKKPNVVNEVLEDPPKVVEPKKTKKKPKKETI